MVQLVNKIKRLKILVLFFRLISPGFGRCKICGLPWNHCNELTIFINTHSGTFATCKYCWDHSSLDTLKKAYSDTYRNQLNDLIRMNYQLGTNDKMSHTLQHLLDCVEKEYKKENIKRRKQKIKSLKKRTKNNKIMNVSLFKEN